MKRFETWDEALAAYSGPLTIDPAIMRRYCTPQGGSPMQNCTPDQARLDNVASALLQMSEEAIAKYGTYREDVFGAVATHCLLEACDTLIALVHSDYAIPRMIFLLRWLMENTRRMASVLDNADENLVIVRQLEALLESTIAQITA